MSTTNQESAASRWEGQYNVFQTGRTVGERVAERSDRDGWGELFGIVAGERHRDTQDISLGIVL